MKLLLSIAIVLLSFCNVKKEQPKNSPELNKKEPEILLLKNTWSEGEIKVVRNNKTVQMISDMELENGDKIVTGPNGSTELLLDLEESIKVGNNSELSISNALNGARNTITNITLSSGRILALISKEKSDNSIMLITPNAKANIQGSVLLAEVIKINPKQENNPCDANTCMTQLIVLSGKMNVKQPGNAKEIVLEKNSQITISKAKELAQKEVIPLEKKNLSKMQGMLTFHAEEPSVNTKLLDEYKVINEPIKISNVTTRTLKKKTIVQKKSSVKKQSRKGNNLKKNKPKNLHKK